MVANSDGLFDGVGVGELLRDPGLLGGVLHYSEDGSRTVAFFDVVHCQNDGVIHELK